MCAEAAIRMSGIGSEADIVTSHFSNRRRDPFANGLRDDKLGDFVIEDLEVV